jgi:hypothetical protein
LGKHNIDNRVRYFVAQGIIPQGKSRRQKKFDIYEHLDTGGIMQ